MLQSQMQFEKHSRLNLVCLTVFPKEMEIPFAKQSPTASSTGSCLKSQSQRPWLLDFQKPSDSQCAPGSTSGRRFW